MRQEDFDSATSIKDSINKLTRLKDLADIETIIKEIGSKDTEAVREFIDQLLFNRIVCLEREFNNL